MEMEDRMRELDYTEIGKRIRSAREAQGLTQEEASERCDITPSFYGNIERGDKKMSIETLARISVGLNVSADHILFGSLSGETSEDQNSMVSFLTRLQAAAGEKQFKKYCIVIKNLAEIIDKL